MDRFLGLVGVKSDEISQYPSNNFMLLFFPTIKSKVPRYSCVDMGQNFKCERAPKQNTSSAPKRFVISLENNYSQKK